MKSRKKVINRCIRFPKPLFLRVRFFQFLFFVLAFTTVQVKLAAQDEPARRRGSRIIDDTTKQVYGPTTSRYYYESDVFFNRDVLRPIDTVIRNFHRFSDVQRNGNMYQDLGNIGTAMRPIFYDVPEVIGVSPGFTSYDVYWNRETIRYFDTKSPYSNMHVILGGGGRSITRATYSRNIKPNWNFGFTYRGIFADKQVGRQGKGDRNARGHYYDFFTTYQNKDSTYRVFFNFRRNNHLVVESGGVRLLEDFDALSDYFETDAQPSLLSANSRELRMNIHLFHQFKIGKALQLYHQLDRYRQGNRYTDLLSSEPEDYFDHIEIEGDSANDKVVFKHFRNEVGIKGSVYKFFYNGYYAIRDYSMTYNRDTLGMNTSGIENYLGGRIGIRLDSLVDVSGWAEVMPTGNYRIEGAIKSKWFEASLKQVQYAPSFMQQAYRGKHDFWNNTFSDVNATRLSGSIHYRSSVVRFSPGLTLTRLGNYIFFKRVSRPDRVVPTEGETVPPAPTEVEPVQTQQEQVIFSPMVQASLTFFRHVHLRTHAIYSHLLQESDDAIQLPELFVNGQLSYENIFFRGNLDMHAGIDVHWKSDYYAMGFDVPTQQYYVQKPLGVETRELFLTPAFPVIDVFFNAKIKRARIFVKYNNLLQLVRKEGYFPTPRYPGQRNVIDFGFDWSFYD